MLVKIIPKSQRAKNRVKEHGEVMALEKAFQGRFLVYSIKKTWMGFDGVMEHWSGWFTENEAYYEVVKSEF